MTDEPKRRDGPPDREERPAEPASPGAAVGGQHKDLPGEGELPRREDMGPSDHRPRKDGEADASD